MVYKYLLIVLLFGSGIDGQSTAAAPAATATASPGAATSGAPGVATTSGPGASTASASVPIITTAAPVIKVDSDNTTKGRDKDFPGKDWTYYSKTGKYYRVFSGFLVTHNEAEFICQTYLGETNSKNISLVTLSSWEEQKFVYSLALMSTTNKVTGEAFWVGATLAHAENYKWTTSAKEDNATSSQNFDKLFDPYFCDSCKPRRFKCGVLDLIRGPIVFIPPQNRWKFIECIFKHGFICQMGSK